MQIPIRIVVTAILANKKIVGDHVHAIKKP